MARSVFKQGEQMVWLTGAALSISLLSTFAIIVVVMVNGLGYFWPGNVASATLKDGSTVLGEIADREDTESGEVFRYQFKVGNRDLYGADFRWIDASDIVAIEYPAHVAVLERREFGNFYGFPRELKLRNVPVDGSSDWERLIGALENVETRRRGVDAIAARMSALNLRLESMRLEVLELRYEQGRGAEPRIAALEARMADVRAEFDAESAKASALLTELGKNVAVFADAAGETKDIALTAIVRSYRPNSMSVFEKMLAYAERVRELLWEEPRESNTEGGLFPAIFGTVNLVLVMSLFCIPLGVVAAVYLQEYAAEGFLVRLVRIAVFNLAGVPSIVYGIFGLGFFIYGIGGSIDRLFFPERLPTPTFGTGGIFWASLTLALLTVPVVIVATEEALAAIPKGLREASLSLGATKFQTIITGFVLATARAAGEVAPLMITGVVKLAPTLPIDGVFPFVHLERKFMHLGFHIYDVGFQSPNVEAAKPMVYITTLLLLGIVVLLSLTAILLRNTMQKRYATKTF